MRKYNNESETKEYMVKDIFDKSVFNGYRVDSINESVQEIYKSYNYDGSVVRRHIMGGANRTLISAETHL